ncbi:TetR family transcriptional regulator [Microbacterium sp. 18062]|uniref:TetR family transcriptional regulator n=1 Tax=Microbacterium sp. 18062 TaxID=2681410 RepID=UPI00135CE1D9|nr:TetR family transcriptional regulator [Microbacterium sp. 18062]
MLDAAEELLADGAISVGLHHLNMEELIRRVGVPRSSAFAAFGGKDELLTALMLRLLDPAGPHSLGYSPGTNDVTAAAFRQHADLLTDAEGRPDPDGTVGVLHEAIRRGLARNVADTVQSAEWRTYMALSVSVSSLPPAQQPRVRAALQAAETRFLEQMAEDYRSALTSVGLRPVEGVTWIQIAAIGASLVEGIASKRLIGIPDADGVVLRPGIDGEPVEWELAALAFAAMIDGLTRPVA